AGSATVVDESGPTGVDESGQTVVDESGPTVVDESGPTGVDESGQTVVDESGVEDETPEVLKDFLTMIQRHLQALVISVRTDRGTECNTPKLGRSGIRVRGVLLQ
ncbi:hypothetical protein Tco_1251731, partial [Tanacetum coccineum]